MNAEEIGRFVNLLNSDHLESVPVRKKSLVWRKLPKAINRHHRLVGYMLDSRNYQNFNSKFTNVVRSHCQDKEDT